MPTIISPQDFAPAAGGPKAEDLNRCVHCGLCLNACPTYRELGLEMDSPRGRIYQMVQVRAGRMELNEDYIEHIDLCLACRACETACPSGVQYGKLVEAARAQIAEHRVFPKHVDKLRRYIFERLLVTPKLLKRAGYLLWLFQRTGMQALIRRSGILKTFGRLAEIERLSPTAELPFFFNKIGKVFPANGEQKHRVAFLAGCIANVSFARLNEATVRVLQQNGCEVTVSAGQGCCGALHVHAGLQQLGREQARKNIEAIDPSGYDAIITNAAGCGSVVKEYPELFEDDGAARRRASEFSAKVKDITEFLASIQLNTEMGPLPLKVTYQDSCHLLHGQKVQKPPRMLLSAIPQIEFAELPLSEICCGSAGIYNIEQTDMSMKLLKQKMEMAEMTGAPVIATANPGCMLQLQAGARLFGRGQRVVHVIELLDQAYQAYKPAR